MRRVLILLPLLLLIGCAGRVKYDEFIETHGTDSPEHLTLYLYRPSTLYAAMGGDPGIWMGDERLGTLSYGNFARLDLPAGDHTIEARWHPMAKPYGARDSAISFSGEAGDTIYVKYDVLSTSSEATGLGPNPVAVSGVQRFIEISPEYALDALSEMRGLPWSSR